MHLKCLVLNLVNLMNLLKIFEISKIVEKELQTVFLMLFLTISSGEALIQTIKKICVVTDLLRFHGRKLQTAMHLPQ